MANDYYDGTKLLSLKDLDGKTPEIYIVSTNRTAGKTTYFGRYMVNRYLKHHEKFMLLYRYSYELDNVADVFFKDIQSLFFPEHEMTSVKMDKGAYASLLIDDVECGYAVAINSSDRVKKLSHLFSDTAVMFLDEMQLENGKYIKDEITKLISIHTSVARGHGEQVRRVPLIMCGNSVTILNPYYTILGIGKRLRSDTKYLRGHGWVFEQGFNETASKAQKESGFNVAFSDNKYVEYASMNRYLHDDLTFIEEPKDTNSIYQCTLKCDSKYYAIRYFPNSQIMYCSDKPDMTFPLTIAVSTEDMQSNCIMLQQFHELIQSLRNIFERGCFRFRNVDCKNAVMTALSYY